MTNVNLREEFEQPYTKEQQYEKHQKMLSASEDLHMALRSCQEINEAKSLYQFFLDVQKINPEDPRQKRRGQTEKRRGIFEVPKKCDRVFPAKLRQGRA